MTRPPVRRRAFRRGMTPKLFRRTWVSSPSPGSRIGRSPHLGTMHRRLVRIRGNDLFGILKDIIRWGS